MPDSADKTASTGAPQQREYRFNKFGSVGKAAGFLMVTMGYVARSIFNDFDGDLTVANVVAEVSPAAALFYLSLLIALLTLLIRAAMKPQNRLTVGPDEVVFRTGTKPQRIQLADVLAVAPFEQPKMGVPWRKRSARSLAVLSAEGTNLAKLPTGVTWRAATGGRAERLEATAQERMDRDLVEEILAETVANELPDDEFGRVVRRNVGASASQQIKSLKSANPGLRAMVIPLQGMPTETEDELRQSIPNWL